jgi:glycosyltransferase involved in cell wall biosynthesis
MVEAMLCGTPVVATSIGAVPEIVEEGLTGVLASSADQLAQAASRVLTLDRRAVRERAQERFSAERMAQSYLELYERVVASAVGDTLNGSTPAGPSRSGLRGEARP